MSEKLFERRTGGRRDGSRKKVYNPSLPVISVITVVYNRRQGMEQTIKSVRAQQYPNIEYIIVDGASTDGTLELIASHDDDIDFWMSERDKGIYDAMNKGVDLATGDYINCLNAGDVFYGTDALSFFSNELSADIIYGDALIQYEGFQVEFPKNNLAKMWKFTPFCHQASFAKASVLKEFKFDTTFKVGADHDFFYRCFLAGKKFEYRKHLVCLFDGRDGMTKRQIVSAITDKRNIAMKYQPGFFKKLYYEGFIFWVQAVSVVKRIIGPKITASIVRLIRK
jgi:glycosyltransferase involved in cell wall biosynthesis